jgi:predicted ester cyclase
MDPEGNKQLTTKFFDEVWTNGNVDYIDVAYAPNFVLHAMWLNPSLGRSGDASGPQQAKEIIARWHEALPDLKVTVEEQVAQGDTVVTRHWSSGTHLKEFQGIKPTGTTASFSGITITRIEGDKMVEAWTCWDGLGMLQAFGVIPKNLKLMAWAQRLGIVKLLQKLGRIPSPPKQPSQA